MRALERPPLFEALLAQLLARDSRADETRLKRALEHEAARPTRHTRTAIAETFGVTVGGVPTGRRFIDILGPRGIVA